MTVEPRNLPSNQLELEPNESERVLALEQSFVRIGIYCRYDFGPELGPGFGLGLEPARGQRDEPGKCECKYKESVRRCTRTCSEHITIKTERKFTSRPLSMCTCKRQFAGASMGTHREYESMELEIALRTCVQTYVKSN